MIYLLTIILGDYKKHYFYNQGSIYQSMVSPFDENDDDNFIYHEKYSRITLPQPKIEVYDIYIASNMKYVDYLINKKIEQLIFDKL